MADQTTLWAVIPAAGLGRRMASSVPKQFLGIGDKTVLEHSLDALYAVPGLKGLVLVADDSPELDSVIRRYASHDLIRATGGRERCHSVLNGLQALAGHAQANDWVLVHDAARPCVRASDLQQLVTTSRTTSSGGLLGAKVCDTMKQADARGAITATVERTGLWRAFTPQMFRYSDLQTALDQALADGLEVTDEASAMEHAGHRPQLVEGHADNIKITRPEDLPLAELYLKQQGRL